MSEQVVGRVEFYPIVCCGYEVDISEVYKQMGKMLERELTEVFRDTEKNKKPVNICGEKIEDYKVIDRTEDKYQLETSKMIETELKFDVSVGDISEISWIAEEINEIKRKYPYMKIKAEVSVRG